MQRVIPRGDDAGWKFEEPTRFSTHIEVAARSSRELPLSLVGSFKSEEATLFLGLRPGSEESSPPSSTEEA